MFENILGFIIFIVIVFGMYTCTKTVHDMQVSCIKSCTPYRVAYIDTRKNLCGCETNIEMREPK